MRPRQTTTDRHDGRRTLRGFWHAARHPALNRRGFTLLEILMAVLIVVIGVIGIMAMQIVAIQANSTARDTTEAVNVGEHFATLLQQDASQWTLGSDLTSTTYLSDVGADWQVAFSGEPVNIMGVPAGDLDTKEVGRAKFCVGYRLEWAVTGEVITGLVRIYWPKLGGDDVFSDCGPGGNGGGSLSVSDLDTEAPGANMVTFPVSVRRTHVD